MNAPDEQPWGDLTLEALKERLRGLPPPAVPPGLESQLLGTIPPLPRVAGPRRRGIRLMVCAVLGLAAALVVAVPLLRSGRTGAGETPLPGAFESTSPQYILAEFVGRTAKESDPCYILPGHSESRF